VLWVRTVFLIDLHRRNWVGDCPPSWVCFPQ
jgi:hypothetical protein